MAKQGHLPAETLCPLLKTVLAIWAKPQVRGVFFVAKKFENFRFWPQKCPKWDILALFSLYNRIFEKRRGRATSQKIAFPLLRKVS